MINSIQISNNLSLNHKMSSNTNFCASTHNVQEDTFEKKSKKSKTNTALIALSGATTAFAGLVHHKLGTVIKAVDKNVPITPWGRLKKVFELTTKDSMTGLHNKATLMNNITSTYKDSMKKNEPFSVGMLDMDNFKGINEVFNHKTGDVVLTQIAKNIISVSEKYGLKGYRYGGEEFVLIMPGHDSASSKKIIEEIAQSIKKDTVIQGYVPKFINEAKDDMQFVYYGISELKSLFPKLRKEEPVADYRALASEVINLLEAHLGKYKPTDKKAIEELITKLSNAQEEELPMLLSVKTETGDHSTLGHELDKINSQYSGMENDLLKWMDHINLHKMFTVSGGTVTLTKDIPIDKSEHAIKIADAALKSAKTNGKNTIINANNELIQKALEEAKKE